MAVIDLYQDPDQALQPPRRGRNWRNGGARSSNRLLQALIGATDSAGSRYRFPLDANDIPMRAKVCCDALTAGTSYDLGLARAGVGGATITAALFAAAMDLHTQIVGFSAAGAINGLGALANANLGKKIWELSGDTEEPPTRQFQYDLILTANTPSTVAGSAWILLETIDG